MSAHEPAGAVWEEEAARYGYVVELPLFAQAPSCAELIAEVLAAGECPPPALTIDDVILIRRVATARVRSCSTSATYQQVAITHSTLVAQAPPYTLQPGEASVRAAQVGESAAYAALHDLNRRRLLHCLTVAQLQ